MKDKKVAIIAMYAGIVDRGAETSAWYLYKGLPYKTIVFSKATTDWTNGVLFKVYPIWHWFIKVSKLIGLYRLLYQIEKIIPYFNVFTEEFLDDCSFCKNLIANLDDYKPDIVLNLAGSTTGYFLAKYRDRTGVKFISLSIAGKNLSEIKNLNCKPDVFVVPTPSAMEYFTYDRTP